MNALVHRATIYEIEAARNRSIALYGEAYDTLHEAAKATPPGTMQLPLIGWSGHGGYISRMDRTEFLAKLTKDIDTGVWNHLILATGLDTLMDRTERDAFREECRENPPPATVENCMATMERLMGDRELIFKRGIAKTFSRLDRRFRSHDGFKIGARMVLSRMLDDNGWWNHWAKHDETLLDVERAFALLDGKPQPERDAGIVGAIKLAKTTSFKAEAFTASSEYFRVNVFMNGNAHVWFERKDLIEKVNLLLAEYYGAALGAGSDAAEKHHAPNRTPAKNFGFFETPPAVVERVLDEARLSLGVSVLEPSAGRGALAIPAGRITRKVQCIEIQPANAEHLRQVGYPPVICADFFDMTPERLGLFDRIVANPPFDQGRDVDHVLHMLKFLAPDGVVVSVMSAGTEFKTDQKTSALKAEMARRGGYFRDLPAGSFSESGTNVNTVICVIGRAR